MLLCCAYERNSGMILRNAIMMNVRARAHFLDLLSFIECLLKCYHHHKKKAQRKASHHPDQPLPKNSDEYLLNLYQLRKY